MADGFQKRRLKCEKLTDDRQQTTNAKWCQKATLPLAQLCQQEKFEVSKGIIRSPMNVLNNEGAYKDSKNTYLCSKYMLDIKTNFKNRKYFFL